MVLWHAITGTGGMDWRAYVKAHPSKVQRRVRKGVPDQLRGLVWQLLSGGRDLLLKNEGVYGELVGRSPGPRDAEIVRDLNRTYPSHVYYQQRQGPGQLSLYNVLKAYSLYDKKVASQPSPIVHQSPPVPAVCMQPAISALSQDPGSMRLLWSTHSPITRKPMMPLMSSSC